MIRIVDFSENAYAPAVTFKELMMKNEMAADYAAATIEAGQKNNIQCFYNIHY
jgi:hypothetical protein